MRQLIPALFLGVALFGIAASTAQQPQAPGGNPLDVVPDRMPFDVPYGPPVTLQRALTAIGTAVAEAKKHDWKLNVAVVDSGANLVAFQRMDGAQLASIQVSEHKARTAALYRRETKAFENAISSATRPMS
jgi:glc operon protein GlcG